VVHVIIAILRYKRVACQLLALADDATAAACDHGVFAAGL
jgi:hypothetical protein